MTLLAALCVALLAACDAPAPTPAPAHFSEVAAASGLHFEMRSGGQVKNYILESKGGGGAFIDYDGDGWLDIYLVNGAQLGSTAPPNALYRNQGFDLSSAEGNGAFDDRTEAAGVGGCPMGHGLHRGRLRQRRCERPLRDQLRTQRPLSQRGRWHLPRGRPSGRRVDLADWSTSATFGDYDRDGDLDLYVAQYLHFAPERVPPRGGMWKGVLVFAGPLGLTGAQDALYRNEGDGTFRNVTRQAHVEQAEPTYGLGALFCDYDRDGDPDLYVANDSAPNFLYRNEGDTFREIGVAAGAALSAEGVAQAGMGIAYGDYDRDGFGDFLVTHFEDDYNTLYHNRRDGTFAVASAAAGLAEPSLPHLAFGTCFLDYDNDQDQDLFVANGHVYPQIRHLDPDGYAEPNQLFANEGPSANYRFSSVAAGDLNLPAVSRGAAKGDCDNDGDVDLLVFNLDGPPSLLRNDSGNQLNWLSFLLVGTASNRDGIGARIAVVSGGVEQIAERVSGGSFLSHSDGRVHFGLGANPTAERIEIHWPSGRTQYLEDVAANQFLVVEEPRR